MPSSWARCTAWSGPAPPNATRAKSRGLCPRSTEIVRMARAWSHSRYGLCQVPQSHCHTLVRLPLVPWRRWRAVDRAALSHPKTHRGVAAKYHIGIGDGGMCADAIAGWPRIGSGTLRANPQCSTAIEAHESIHRRHRRCGYRGWGGAHGNSATVEPPLRGNAPSPECYMPFDVPPISNEIQCAIPICWATANAPTMPPAGPDKVVRAASVWAVDTPMLPSDAMTRSRVDVGRCVARIL
jgi:hypothetical protein